MSLEAYQEKLIHQLIEQERLLSKLYSVFSDQFPDHRTFWTGLSNEESRHAQLLEKLLEAARSGKVMFDEGKVKTYTLFAFIDRLKAIIQKAENHEFGIKQAMAQAADYETSLIEKNVFTRFDSVSEKSRNVLKVLGMETMKHIEKIKLERSRIS